MPTIAELIQEIEKIAPRAYQESYDNARLITGNKHTECNGVLLTLDSTEAVVQEAIDKGCNLIIAHHPIVFKGLKQFTGSTYVERTIIKAIKNDIAIYACHTNLDNQLVGVNAKICDKLGLVNQRVLAPKVNTLLHLVAFVPKNDLFKVREALFQAGAGKLGNYSECSFSLEGVGTFLPNEQANPTIGQVHQFEEVDEARLEVILPIHLKEAVLQALKSAHPYEEVAYYMTELINENQEIGAGMIGELPMPIDALFFLESLKETMNTKLVRHTAIQPNQMIQTVAVCGGVGSFLLPMAKAKGACIFITSDVKYHEFFDADEQLILADIGHFESEQYTNELFAEIITKKYSTFAVHFSMIKTNPINYI